jgi:hypothetical protein
MRVVGPITFKRFRHFQRSCGGFQVRFHSLLILPVVALLAGAACDVSAAQGNDRDVIYEMLLLDGVMHRIDKRNGRIQKLGKHPNGAYQWIDADMVDDKAPQPAQHQIAGPVVPLPPQPNIPDDVRKKLPQEGNVAAIGIGRRGGAPVIDDDEPSAAKPATQDITPELRKENLAVIASYENKVMPSSAIQTGERMKGTIFMRNSGDRRIKVLELTMFVAIKGVEKPEEHHIVFCNKPGHMAPPQPGVNGRDPAALLYKVDMPAPGGEVKGPPEVKITYLEFE